MPASKHRSNYYKHKVECDITNLAAQIYTGNNNNNQNLYITGDRSCRESITPNPYEELPIMSIVSSIDDYDIINSDTDGHCFMYSVISSLKSQLGVGYDYFSLLDMIKQETIFNKRKYIPFMPNMSEQILFEGMHDYLKSKIYNSKFVDALPLIVSNILCMTITILETEISGQYSRKEIKGKDVNDKDKAVVVLKRHDHYDGLSFSQLPHQKCETTTVCSPEHKSSCEIQLNKPAPGLRNAISECDPISVCSSGQLSFNNVKMIRPAYESSELCNGESQNQSQADQNVINHTTNKCLSFFTWNIYGLTQDKLDIMYNELNKFDVILFTECWTEKSDEYLLAGYEFINYPRSFRHENAKRNSGGMCAFIKDDIYKGVRIGKCSEEIVTWLIFDKNYFGLDRNLHVGNAYIVSDSSPFYRLDAFDILENDIDRIDFCDNVIICGDLNSYCNVEIDYVIEPPGHDIEFNGLPDVNELYRFNNENINEIHCLHEQGLLKRFSLDSRPMNNNGRHLIDLCKSRGMLIINGRISEDKGVGNFTRYDHSDAPSVVDFVVSNAKCFKEFEYFKVHPKLPESDHLPIMFSLKCNRITSKNDECVDNELYMYEPLQKIGWRKSDLDGIEKALLDNISLNHLNIFHESMLQLQSPNTVGVALTDYINQAILRVCPIKNCHRKSKSKQCPAWYDTELRLLRSKAVKAGQNATSPLRRNKTIDACKQYRSAKQRKIRQFKGKCNLELHTAFLNNKSSLWNVLNRINNANRPSCKEPSLSELTEHFKTLSEQQRTDYFDDSYENDAKMFLHNYDVHRTLDSKISNSLELELINSNFTQEEILNAIGYLKNNKSPGIDKIPAEMIKHCQYSLSGHITMAFNYIIEQREFPESWSEGLRSAIFKSGKTKCVENYRGITILPILEKIFEVAVYKRLSFANEAFCKIDENNGGFLPGRRTADNLFIIQGIIQKQLIMGKSLVLCFVDFSKAFDLVNRNILFYKIMKSGWYGKVIDTLRSLYSKTSYRVKKDGWVSFLIKNVLGVNQGGVASGLLFRKYLSDLDEYLKTKLGICVGEVIIMHILWADDLILITDGEIGMQRHLDGLLEFCRKNLAIVNEIKTKCMTFGKVKKVTVKFNGKIIEQVDSYKCLGNIISPISRFNANPFKLNTTYMCDKARKALYAVSHRTKNVSPLTPEIKFHLFNSLILPILTYGSEVWSVNKSSLKVIDKMFLRYIRCTLSIKATTSNIITIGESGQYPPSVACKISLMNFTNRLYHMPDSTLAKQVFNELRHLHELGFHTWISETFAMATEYNLDLSRNVSDFKIVSKNNVRAKFRNDWDEELHDIERNPILRTYITFKSTFTSEPYLKLVKEHNYRVAISRLRCSSHTLAIERRRYERPKPPIEQRVCIACKSTVEDEIHFVTQCAINIHERTVLEAKIYNIHASYIHFSDTQKFAFLNTSYDARILTWYGKFLHNSFKSRNLYIALQN